jgi:uncharacterized integral membrane protein
MDSSSPASVPPEIPVLPGNRLCIALTLAAAGFMAWLGDFLFWKHTPGISLAIYICTVTGMVLALHRKNSDNTTIRIAAGLMIAASYATALEISFTNVAVLLALFAVICGECWYGGVNGRWARWSESVVTWIAAPTRWSWFAGRLHKTQLVAVVFNGATGGKAKRLLEILVPASCLTIIFGVVFGLGNAVFSEMIQHSLDQFGTGVSRFDFSPGHLIFWLISATLALAWTYPRPAPSQQRPWARALPQISRNDSLIAIWQSRLVLIVLNALFFMVNTIDVFYLWNRTQLPEGVSFSQFVHEGVGSLILAVLLSALVIALIFQQEEKVKCAPFLKGLSLLWIAQNLVQIAGVFLRLKLYVQAYELSEERIYVGCFLLLVMVGFCLLAWHVARDGYLNQLIFRCAMATFILFFVIQFTNDAGMVAGYNVARWKHNPARHALDVSYLASLGPDAWPSLIEVASVSDNPDTASAQARSFLYNLANEEQTRMANFDWRSWQARRDSLASKLISAAKKLPPPGTSLVTQDGSQGGNL